MAIRDALLIIEKKGQLATDLSKWLRFRGRHSISVETVEVISSLLESNDRISAILLIDDDPVEDSLANNLKMLRQWSQRVPIIVSTQKIDVTLEKKIRQLGVFYFHTEFGGMDNLKTAVECALDRAKREDLFLTLPPTPRHTHTHTHAHKKHKYRKSSY